MRCYCAPNQGCADAWAACCYGRNPDACTWMGGHCCDFCEPACCGNECPSGPVQMPPSGTIKTPFGDYVIKSGTSPEGMVKTPFGDYVVKSGTSPEGMVKTPFGNAVLNPADGPAPPGTIKTPFGNAVLKTPPADSTGAASKSPATNSAVKK